MSDTNIHTGVYEQIINRLFKLKLNEVDAGRFYIGKKLISKDNAVHILSKSTPSKNEPRSDAEENFRSSSAPRKWLEKFFQRAKSDLCGKQKASMLSLF